MTYPYGTRGYLYTQKKCKFFIFKKGKKTAPIELEMIWEPGANANKRGDWMYNAETNGWYKCVASYGPAPRKNSWEHQPTHEVPAMFRAWLLIL